MSISLARSSAPRAWLSEFLLLRGAFKGPTGQPLYSYQTTEEEYRSLLALVVQSQAHALEPVHQRHWAACFCLYIAETFRRHYDAVNIEWTWANFEKDIGCAFTQAQHSLLVEQGLPGYWKRPIRHSAAGRSYLGSLFQEGGLPWPLVQSETHGFGRLVRRAISRFYEARAAQQSTVVLTAEYENVLPKTFRNPQTHQLLAGIVETLMDLATAYPELRTNEDPVRFLDERRPDWRSSFPLPLDQINAKNLITDWLRDAGRRREEQRRSKALAELTEFTCSSVHKLVRDSHGWYVRSQITLPHQALFDIDLSTCNTTRFEVVIMEGDRLASRGGVVYGTNHETNQILVRFSTRVLEVPRRSLGSALTLRLIESGRVICIREVGDSSFNFEDAPLIFEQDDDEWRLSGTTSCALLAPLARVRLPTGFDVVSGDGRGVEIPDASARWLEFSSDFELHGPDDQAIHVALSSAASNPTLQLRGNLCEYSGTVSPIYLGWPTLKPDAEAQACNVFISGTSPLVVHRHVAGTVRYQVKNSLGHTLLRRRFGVLPAQFRLASYPATRSAPARLSIQGAERVSVQARANGLEATSEEQNGILDISLKPTQATTPEIVQVVVGGGANIEPVVLEIPYPKEGAQLRLPPGKHIDRDCVLEDLLGAEVVLSPAGRRQRFYIELTLNLGERGHKGPSPRRTHVLDLGPASTTLSLSGYWEDIVQLFAVAPNRDSSVSLRINSAFGQLLGLEFFRYSGDAKIVGTNRVEIRTYHRRSEDEVPLPCAVLLAHPAQEPIKLSPVLSQGVATGDYELPPALERDGPWLIAPASGSTTRFRPVYFPGAHDAILVPTAAPSLRDAVKLFHPENNPLAIDDRIAELTKDLSGSDWQYFIELKAHHAHLPLSTFEAWMSLARNPDALVLAVLRLELDESFCARLRDELSVMWAAIPTKTWVHAFAALKDWLEAVGAPETTRHTWLELRLKVLANVISGGEYVAAFVGTGDPKRLRAIDPMLVLPTWYQDLRRRNESNDRWPTQLARELRTWASSASVPDWVKRLPQIEYTDAVTYAPLFLACVAAGRSSLSDLPGDLTTVKYALGLLADFDRAGWYEPAYSCVLAHLLATY
jgi:hypothetical protein